jgi:hypothetical protein
VAAPPESRYELGGGTTEIQILTIARELLA